MTSRPELKVDDEQGFIKFFKALPVRDDDTVRIFDRGDFYTAHGDDASFIARTVSSHTHHYVQEEADFVTGLQNHIRPTTARPKRSHRPPFGHNDYHSLPQFPA
jgi:DNA mismatch repair protein MSH2